MVYETLSLIGGIIFGALGMLSVIASREEGQSNGILSWAGWLLYIPAFYLLFFSFEGFGVAGGYALWCAGTAIIVAIVGVRWGDKPSIGQIISIILVIVGLVGFGLTG